MERVKNTSIVRIPNFLPDDLFGYYLDLFKGNSFFNQKDEVGRSMFSPHHYCNDAVVDSVMKEYSSLVVESCSLVYGMTLADLSGTGLRKWHPGEFQPPHSDCEADLSLDKDLHVVSNLYNNFSSLFIEYAALLYLNDEYEGGEIYFPQHDIEIKPSINELITFPGSYYYMHGVREVASGSRFVMQNFLTNLKMRYIWENFVVPNVDISFTSKTLEDLMFEKNEYNRSNVPKHFIYNNTGRYK